MGGQRARSSEIAKAMKEKVKPLFDAGKIVEAEAELDRVLEQLNPDGKTTESPTAQPASSQASATSEKPKYLVFWNSPEKAGELAERVGMKGDGKTRLLGFGLPISTYEFEEHLPRLIRLAFAAAREHDMAVMLSFRFPCSLGRTARTSGTGSIRTSRVTTQTTSTTSSGTAGMDRRTKPPT